LLTIHLWWKHYIAATSDAHKMVCIPKLHMCQVVYINLKFRSSRNWLLSQQLGLLYFKLVFAFTFVVHGTIHFPTARLWFQKLRVTTVSLILPRNGSPATAGLNLTHWLKVVLSWCIDFGVKTDKCFVSCAALITLEIRLGFEPNILFTLCDAYTTRFRLVFMDVGLRRLLTVAGFFFLGHCEHLNAKSVISQ
jgi:uncharacterized membrane protein YphA (DoxX/SURF4 family)